MLVVSIQVSGETTEIIAPSQPYRSAQEAETMSGRLDLWEFTERMIADRPLLGYGLGSFETYAQVAWAGETRNDLVQPHNTISHCFTTAAFQGRSRGSLPLSSSASLVYDTVFAEGHIRSRDLVTGYSEADLPSNSVMATFTFFIVLALDARRYRGLERRATMALAEVPQVLLMKRRVAFVIRPPR